VKECEGRSVVKDLKYVGMVTTAFATALNLRPPLRHQRINCNTTACSLATYAIICYYSPSIFVISLSLYLAATLLPERELFSLNFEAISPNGTKSVNVHHDPSTVAARVDSSERECRILETVSPPRENARSTSVEVANKLSDKANKI